MLFLSSLPSHSFAYVVSPSIANFEWLFILRGWFPGVFLIACSIARSFTIWMDRFFLHTNCLVLWVLSGVLETTACLGITNLTFLSLEITSKKHIEKWPPCQLI